MKKTEELGRFLSGKPKTLNFSEPVPKIVRSDSLEMRKRIVELNQKAAQKIGIGKSTLYHLKKQASNQKPFIIHYKYFSIIWGVRIIIRKCYLSLAATFSYTLNVLFSFAFLRR